jgi:hypothetical protein
MKDNQWKIKEDKLKIMYSDAFKIDKRIIPLFKTPIILKKIDLLKYSNNEDKVKVQRKLVYKIKTLNQKLSKYSRNIKRFKIEINQIILNNIKNNNEFLSSANAPLSAGMEENKFLFLSKDDIAKLRLYLNKIFININENFTPFLKKKNYILLKNDLKKKKIMLSNKGFSFYYNFLFSTNRYRRLFSYYSYKRVLNKTFKALITYYTNNLLSKKKVPSALHSDKKYKTDKIGKHNSSYLNITQNKKISGSSRSDILRAGTHINRKKWIVPTVSVIKNFYDSLYMDKTRYNNFNLVKFSPLASPNANSPLRLRGVSKERDAAINLNKKGEKKNIKAYLKYNWMFWKCMRVYKFSYIGSLRPRRKLYVQPSVFKFKSLINKNDNSYLKGIQSYYFDLEHGYNNKPSGAYVIPAFNIKDIRVGGNTPLIKENQGLLNPFSLWLRKLSLSYSIHFFFPSLTNTSKKNSVNLVATAKLKADKNTTPTYGKGLVNVHNNSVLTALPLMEKKKKIIDIKNLLLILNNMQNYVELLISIRKKLILKKRIKKIKQVLAEKDKELELEKLKNKIEIFNFIPNKLFESVQDSMPAAPVSNTKKLSLIPLPNVSSPSPFKDKVGFLNKEEALASENKKKTILIFPAKEQFYLKGIIKFKEDIKLMLQNSFDLIVLMKDDLSFDQLIYEKIKFNNKLDKLSIYDKKEIFNIITKVFSKFNSLDELNRPDSILHNINKAFPLTKPSLLPLPPLKDKSAAIPFSNKVTEKGEIQPYSPNGERGADFQDKNHDEWRTNSILGEENLGAKIIKTNKPLILKKDKKKKIKKLVQTDSANVKGATNNHIPLQGSFQIKDHKERLYFKFLSAKPNMLTQPHIDTPLSLGFSYLPKINGDSSPALSSTNVSQRQTIVHVERGRTNISALNNKGLNFVRAGAGIPALLKMKMEETLFNLSINSAIKENKKKMVETIKFMLFNHKLFDPEISTIKNISPVNLIFYRKDYKPVINRYLKAMSIYNMIIKGTFVYFSSVIGYFFKKKNFKQIKNVYKLLLYCFKTMFCLISKPVIVYKKNKIIVQLFYFLIVPNFLKDKILRINRKYINFTRLLIRLKKKNKNFKLRLLPGTYKKMPRKYFLNRKRKWRIIRFRRFKDNIKIALKKASNVSLINLYPNKFKKICFILNKLFKKNIELNLIRLHYPYENSNIFASFLALLVNKIKFRRITRKIFKNAVIKKLKNIVSDDNNKYIPAYLTGMTIKIAGRLMKYKVIPRKTVQKVQVGVSSFGKVNFTDFARYTSKNRRGAFSITVSSGQNFFN